MVQRYKAKEFLGKNLTLYTAQLVFQPEGYLNRIDFYVGRGYWVAKNALNRKFDTVENRKYAHSSLKDSDRPEPFCVPRIITIATTFDYATRGEFNDYLPYFFNDETVKGYLIVDTYVDPKSIINYSLIDKDLTRVEAEAINSVKMRSARV